MPQDNTAYYRRRAAQERARADLHRNPTVAQVHRTLAEMYEERADIDAPMPLRAVRG